MRLLKFFSKFSRSMSVYRSKINTVTGKAEWTVEDEKYDFYQEIARSGYADMLHDTERNRMYFSALKNVIDDLKKAGRLVHVLDIGTGTGLLSMMAAKAGADRVTACEAFMPMAETARKIIAANGFSNRIRVVEKRSTDMLREDLGDDGAANVCVAEVFDTELIGEGALRTFLEAHQRFLAKNSRVIPAKGTVYVQVIESNVIDLWAKIRPISVQTLMGRILVETPQQCENCYGSNSVHDLQLDQLPPTSFVPLAEPVAVFRFDFEDPSSLNYDENAIFEITSLKEGEARAALMWWDLDMDGTGRVILSTKPNWQKDHPSQWRDHWMQAIYYFPSPIKLSQDQTFWLRATHDEHSLWFGVENRVIKEPLEPPVCSCYMHAVCSRSNLGFLNDYSRYQKISQALEKVVPGTVSLCISDCSVLPFLALQLEAKQVYVVQKSNLHNRIMEDFAKANNVHQDQELILISEISELDSNIKIDCVFGDPFFFHALLPWHNLHFWYQLRECHQRNLLSSTCKMLPKRAHIKGLALELKDLWKIRAPVGIVEGFDLGLFDSVCQKAIELCDAPVEPQPLWEYPSRALSKAFHITTFDMNSPVPGTEILTDVAVALESPGILNAVGLWIEWEFCDNVFISTGLKKPCLPGDKPDWDWYNRQGVYFFRHPYPKIDHSGELRVSAKFSPATGDIDFKFYFEKEK